MTKTFIDMNKSYVYVGDNSRFQQRITWILSFVGTLLMFFILPLVLFFLIRSPSSSPSAMDFLQHAGDDIPNYVQTASVQMRDPTIL